VGANLDAKSGAGVIAGACAVISIDGTEPNDLAAEYQKAQEAIRDAHRGRNSRLESFLEKVASEIARRAISEPFRAKSEPFNPARNP
jgi:hypothetical protein